MSTAPAIPQTPLTLLEGPQTFQVFHDEKASKGRAQILHGSLEELQEKLQALNEAGYGIFFAVNQTDGKGRKAENITKVRAYFCDIDGITEPQEKLHVLLRVTRSKAPPSAVVESRNGLHCYWYAADGENLDPREYAEVNIHLIEKFGGDKQAKDLARVLRVPGFIHRKEVDQPHLVKRIIEQSNRRYTAEELKAAFPLPPKEEKSTSIHFRTEAKTSKPYTHYDDDPEWVWERVVEGLADWAPVDGNKHTVLLLAFGVARKFKVSQSQAESDLYPIVAQWDTKESTEQSIMKHANWAYSSEAEDAHVAGLRKLGVTVNLRRKSRRRKKNP